jgi:glycerophosphoryl diester phosphodiesterase
MITFALLLALQEPVRSEWTLRGRVEAADVVVQAHRGMGVAAPENTIESFELAWSLGAVPKADLRMTRDGVIVAFHDETFARVVKGADADLKKKGVADLTLEEVLKLDVGQGQRVAVLGPVFERMKGRPERRLYLDVKKIDFALLAGEVGRAGVEAQVILASPRHADLRRWKALAPSSGTLLWMGGTEEELRKRFEELREASFAGLTQIQLHVRLRKDATLAKPDPFTLSDAFLIETGRELRERKILFQCLPWGAADGAVYARLLDLGVMSFATDYPKDTVDAVLRYLEPRR